MHPKKRIYYYEYLTTITILINILFKLHPKEVMNFNYLDDISNRVRITNNNIDEILICSQLFITRGSSTLMKAVLPKS